MGTSVPTLSTTTPDMTSLSTYGRKRTNFKRLAQARIMKFYMRIEDKWPHKCARNGVHQLLQVGCKMLLNTTEKCAKWVRKCGKRHVTQKWCDIRQTFVLTTNSKPWVGFPNPPLLWLLRQRGWAKRYTTLPEIQRVFELSSARFA